MLVETREDTGGDPALPERSEEESSAATDQPVCQEGGWDKSSRGQQVAGPGTWRCVGWLMKLPRWEGLNTDTVRSLSQVPREAPGLEPESWLGAVQGASGNACLIWVWNRHVEGRGSMLPSPAGWPTWPCAGQGGWAGLCREENQISLGHSKAPRASSYCAPLRVSRTSVGRLLCEVARTCLEAGAVSRFWPVPQCRSPCL